jgi:hypothetical protein
VSRGQVGNGNGESLALAAQAERERRAGRPERARDLAHAAAGVEPPHPAARVAEVLALIDCGDLVSAHRALERAYLALGGTLEEDEARATAQPAELHEAPPLAALADDELEHAFETAEAQPDEMHDANHVAAAVLERVEDGLPEGVDFTASESPFATETVAGLLESQGQRERASEVRSAARQRGQFREQRLDDARRERVIATLSRWLDNLRRRTA